MGGHFGGIHVQVELEDHVFFVVFNGPQSFIRQVQEDDDEIFQNKVFLVGEQLFASYR